MNELKNKLRVELSCSRCNFTKVITIVLDKDGVFTIPYKFCPHDLNELQRDVLRQFVSEPEPIVKIDDDGSIIKIKPESKPNEPTEDKTKLANTFSKPARPVDLSKNRTGSSKKN